MLGLVGRDTRHFPGEGIAMATCSKLVPPRRAVAPFLLFLVLTVAGAWLPGCASRPLGEPSPAVFFPECMDASRDLSFQTQPCNFLIKGFAG